MPQASLEEYLRQNLSTDEQRAGLWDVYQASKSAGDLADRLKAIDIPDTVKADLWDMKARSAPQAVAQTWADKIGLNAPTASPVVGFLRGAGAGAVDLAQGAASSIANQAKDLGAGLMQTSDTEAGVPSNPAQEIGPVVAQPNTFSGAVGGLLPVAAQMVAGGGKVADAIPNAQRAGKAFQSVMAAAKDVPIVNVEAPGQVALRVMDLAERGGGSLPTPVRQFANWITNPNKVPMTYEVARDFASGISKLSVNEFQRMGPSVAREVANLRVALNGAVAQTAQQAGKGPEYVSAMKEYGQAMRLKAMVDAATEGAKKALPYAVVGGAAGASHWLTSGLRNLLGGE